MLHRQSLITCGPPPRLRFLAISHNSAGMPRNGFRLLPELIPPKERPLKPKREFRHLFPLILLGFFPMIGQAQIIGSSADKTAIITAVNVQIEGMGDLVSGWERVTGGAQVIETSTVTVGADRFGTATAGMRHVEELTLRRPLVARERGWVLWLTEALERGNEGGLRRTVSTTEVHYDGSTGPTTHYMEALPVRYVFPVLSTSDTDPLYESFSVRPARVEISGGSRAIPRSESGLLNGSFQVDGLPDDSPRILSVSIDDLVFDLNDQSGGDSGRRYRVWGLGQPHVGPMTISVLPGTGSGLFTWWEGGSNEGREITVSVLDAPLEQGGRPVLSYTFFDCLPVMYDNQDFSPDSKQAKETFTLSIGRVEFLIQPRR